MGVAVPISLGTTSACAENKPKGKILQSCYRNYLRVRGEYWTMYPRQWKRLELPPRARRIRLTVSSMNTPSGTTSACAENTLTRATYQAKKRNYLRVRGEYEMPAVSDRKAWELPPRARRILHDLGEALTQAGTTSACAENTGCPYEYSELPPRARRIQPPTPIPPLPRGTTSACAENTICLRTPSLTSWNYLRVRGEYPSAAKAKMIITELPPRARRILGSITTSYFVSGTTSACAENTRSEVSPVSQLRNYLRVRGEYETPDDGHGINAGTTSACAENTLNELGLL